MKIIITGGLGFVGRAVAAKALKLDGVDEILVVGRNVSPEPAKILPGIRYLSFDLSKKGSYDWLHDSHTVFHIAAKAGVDGRIEEYMAANLVATESLLNACRKYQVKRFIYTSTPSVVFNNSNIQGGKESLPYLSSPISPYAYTKALAEKLVLDSHEPKRFQTLAIRPHLVWGKGDPHLLPRIIDRHRKGKLRMVGDGTNRMDITHVENVAHAHICAFSAMLKNQYLGGKAYFIGQNEPVLLWPWLNQIFAELGLPPLTKKISFKNAYYIGSIIEFLWKALNLRRDPPMTRFIASQLAHDHWFSNESAEKDIGYKPKIDMKQAMLETLPWLKTI